MREIFEKAKQNSAESNVKFSKCFQFLCNNGDGTWFFNALTFARSLGRCWKPRPSALVFNTSHWTWRMLMHEKPCLFPILCLTGVSQTCRLGKVFCILKCIYSKYWDTLLLTILVLKFEHPFYHLLSYVKSVRLTGKQCRPWSNAVFGGIWSGSSLLAQACLSQYLGMLR